MELTATAALVTGGASGLGAATAAALVERGASVFALDLPQQLERVPAPDGVTFIPADGIDAEQVKAAVEQAGAELPLRTVVNCAGIAPSRRILGRNGVHDPQLFATVLNVNLLGTFTVLAYASEAIAATAPDDDGQRGVIINTASVAAYEGQIGQVA
ncbi:SDR family NAD(P)-dependent oxidoreductase, partial [Arthrobacter sp.]|uniref:SDR family NAD(P)-dependent oxidoreductase n=1 Tax=Arthrobacter sp. TaxID=1667 RepID=UPI0025878727